jgi:cell fate regulator YaaT (PSP1 superfamily)
VGEGVTTSRGHGKIVAINVVKETVSVELDNKETIEVPAEELRRG